MEGNSSLSKNYDYFIFATRYMIKHGGRNGGKLIQKDFAYAVECTPEHLSGILSSKQSRRASIGLQERIAGYFDMPLISYFDFGRTLYEGKDPGKDSKAVMNSIVPSLLEPFSQHQASDENLMELMAQASESAKRTQVELQRLRSIIEMMGDAVAIVSSEQVVEFQNQAHREMFRGVHVGSKCPLFALAEEDEWICPSCETIKTGMTTKTIIGLTDERTMSVTASALRDSSGYVVGAITSIRDITKRQKLMDENVAMRERLAATLEKVGEGVMLYDENRRIIFYNKKFMDLTRATARELETTDSLAGYTRRRGIVTNMDEIQGKMKSAYTSRKKTSVECFHNDGTPSTIYTVEPITTPDGMFLGFMATITEK